MTLSPTRPLAQIVRWLLTLTLLITPFVFTWVNEELFEFPKMMVVYGLMTLAMTAAVIDQLQQKTFEKPKTVFDWAIGFFVTSQVLSTILSIHPRTSWLGYYTRFNGGLLSTLTYVSFYYLAVRYFSPKQMVRVVFGAILAGTLATLYAWPEHFGHSPSCLLIAKTFNAKCWIQDVQSRVFGTFGQPNWLAAYAITLLPLVLAWLTQVKQTWQKIGLSLMWALMLSVVIFTKSRSGLLGLGVGMVGGAGVLAYLAWQQRTWKTAQTLISALVIVAVLSAVIVAGYGTPFTPSMASQLFRPKALLIPTPTVAPSGPSLEVGGTESGEIRKIVWSGAVAIWQRYPFFGSGVETFAYSYYQDRPLAHNHVSEWDFLYNKAHNEVLNYLATTGIVGLIAYLTLWAMLFWVSFKLVRNSHQPAEIRALSLAWAVGLGAQFVSNFFGFSTVMINVLFWLGLASLASWSGATDSLSANKPIEPVALSGWRLGLTVVTLMLGIWGTQRTVSWWTADRDYAASKAAFNAGNVKVGMTKLEQAIATTPDEALFWDELANQYSRLALALDSSPEASSTATVTTELAKAAIAASDQTLALNNRHLDFYKTRARMFINLGQIDGKYLPFAAETLRKASSLAPTDPKLYYNLGLVEVSAGATDQGITDIKTAVALKPDYVLAWSDLGKVYEQASRSAEAVQTYQHILKNVAPNNPEITARLKALQVLKTGP